MTDREPDEVEQLRAELASFTYAVSHDLRAPIRIIDGFTEALLEDYREKLEPQGVDYLLLIREAAMRMELLITSLVELSRVTQAPLAIETVNVTELAESISEELKRADPSRNVSFHIQRDLTVQADPALLRIALRHLLENAWKFTRKHPAARIELGLDESNGRRTLFVRDDGAGFDPVYAGRMFTPFQRFHSDKDFEGTGIGLATVQRIVARHGGRVWAVGKPEAGTTVYIDLK